MTPGNMMMQLLMDPVDIDVQSGPPSVSSDAILFSCYTLMASIVREGNSYLQQSMLQLQTMVLTLYEYNVVPYSTRKVLILLRYP